MATGSPLSLVRLLAALTEMADFLGELSQQVPRQAVRKPNIKSPKSS
jgi:hypothetical protein